MKLSVHTSTVAISLAEDCSGLVGDHGSLLILEDDRITETGIIEVGRGGRGAVLDEQANGVRLVPVVSFRVYISFLVSLPHGMILLFCCRCGGWLL